MVALLFMGLLAQTPSELTLSGNMEPIRTSVKIKPNTYTLADKAGTGAVKVAADNITIDFQGSTIQSPDLKRGRLETLNGLGISVDGHVGVRIMNVRVHGYQFNIKANRCTDLVLENCELGQSRSQKIVDQGKVNNIWLDLRNIDTWRSYGAGAWLEQCNHATVKGIRANQSQNGLILVRCNQGLVVGCDFSYNSGWGVAVNRSSDNVICWNHADFVNRPWAGGWGGDSSGFAGTTHSNRNIWAFNSLTHSGDGFFLATTNGGFDDKNVLREDGTCDGNWIVRNDGSWSTANSFEATFSAKNVFYRNLSTDSNYGFWLGYSKKNLVIGNEIKRSHEDGIAHEQGSDNVYAGNLIEDIGGTAIHLWSGSDARLDQSPSARNFILRNRITRARNAFDLTLSQDNKIQDNVLTDAPLAPGIVQTRGNGINDLTVPRIQEITKLKPVGFRMYRATDLPRGWEWLSPSTYGMRDYRKMIVPWNMKDARTIRLYVRPKVVKRIDLPTWMEASIKGNLPNEWLVTSKPEGASYGDTKGFKFQVFGERGDVATIQGQILDLQWKVRWFKWFRLDHDAYADTEAWNGLFAGPALREETLSDLPEIIGGKSPAPGVPTHHFALSATAKIKLAAGQYQFSTLSDDGIQVMVDGHPVINNWTHHGGVEDVGSVRLLTGVHIIEVRYCQEDGGAALAVHWTRLAAK